MTHSFISIILLFVAAIAGAVEVNADPTGKQCDEGNGMTFEDWMDWRKVTPKPVRSTGHNNNWVGIYVDELAEDTYLRAGAPYPECARIVKPIYNDADGKSVRKLTIMVKMAPGYDQKMAIGGMRQATPPAQELGNREGSTAASPVTNRPLKRTTSSRKKYWTRRKNDGCLVSSACN